MADNKNAVMNKFMVAKTSSFMSVTDSFLNEVEVIVDELTQKLNKNEELSTEEEDFLNVYMDDYYSNKVHYGLNNSPKYDDYLKPIHENLFKYYIANIDKNNKQSVNFLLYYTLTEMCKEFNISLEIKIGDKKYFDKKPTVRAYHNKNLKTGSPVVCFNTAIIKDSLKKSTNILLLLESGFHELEHEVQQQQVNSSKLTNPQALLWAKEKLARKVVGEIFYDSNYSDIFFERDARNYARRRTSNIVLKYGDPKKSKYNLSSIDLSSNSYDLSQNFVDPDKLDINYFKGTNLRKSLGKMPEEEKKKLEDSAIALLDAITTSYLKTYPQLLDEYPVLRNVYTNTGDKKLLTQIQIELETNKLVEISKNPEIKKEIDKKYDELLEGIIETDPELKIESLCQKFSKFGDAQSYIDLQDTIQKFDISYKDVISRINKRIYQLETVLPSDKDFAQAQQELRETKSLKDAMLSHIVDFRWRRSNEQFIIETKKELEDKYGIKIEKYNKYFDENGIFFVSKSVNELDDDFFKNKSKIDKSNSDDMEKLRKIYNFYEYELKQTPFYEAKEEIKQQQEAIAEEIVKQMALGDDTFESGKISRQRGYAKIWLLGIVTVLITIGIIILGVSLN